MLYEIKECKTKAAFAAKPLKNFRLNLEMIKSKFDTSFDSSILLVVKVNGEEVIVHKHGELIFKTLSKEEKISPIAEAIYHESIL
tara:strand:+ start:738 stop:992 length:255 start_codon:yes stop_codon:yes gene_type:complete